MWNHLYSVLGTASLTVAGGCGIRERDVSGDPYHAFCCQQRPSPQSVEAVLTAHGFDIVDAGGSFGGGEICIRGSQETRFKARKLVLKYVAERGWEIGWLADALILQEQWDQIGGYRGPWTRIASVQHRVTPTADVVVRLQQGGMSAHFDFGQAIDFVYVRCEDAARAATLLRAKSFSGVQVH